MKDRVREEQDVAAAALRRAAALAARDEAELRRLMHPAVQWTTFKGSVHARVTDEVRRDGRDQVFTLRLTQTWVRTGDGWRCLAGHASSPAGQGEASGAGN